MAKMWVEGWHRALLAMAAVLLAGCANIAHKQVIAANDFEGPRHLVIFFDGTNNDDVSDTNVKKLHSLVTLQQRRDITALYVEGVGTGTDIAGMGTGLGMAARVRLAYEFLLKHWRPGDRIYLVGFSRGAFGARIVNSMLYHAGLPEQIPPGLTHLDVAKRVFDSVDFNVAVDPAQEPDRRRLVGLALAHRNLQQGAPVEVEVLALWDTVQAMGAPDWGKRAEHKLRVTQLHANVDNPNTRYGDKLCNVHRAYQAVSIDDNREWIFTPLLLTRQHLFAGCTPGLRVPMRDLPDVPGGRLREVWFAGAHSDVGGGYNDALLSGVSLNWMIQQLSESGILPREAAVRQDVHGTSHNPEAGAFSPLYHAVNRDMAGYALSDRSFRQGKICVHESVFDRRRVAPPKAHENLQLVLQQHGTACLERIATRDNFDIFERYREVEPSRRGSCQGPGLKTVEIQKFPACDQGVPR